MLRSWTMVGIGESWWSQTAAGESAFGLVPEVAMAARRLGQHPIAIARLGQDEAAAWVRHAMLASGISTAYLQSDPDLPTGRLLQRFIAGSVTLRYDPRAAFDQLQWDFDLEDAAQQADAVVYGLVARRHGQSSSTIDRFLTACPSSLHLLDFTNRLTDQIDCIAMKRAIEFAHIILIDAPAAAIISPAYRDLEPSALSAALLRDLHLKFAVVIADGSIHAASDHDFASAPVHDRVLTNSAMRAHLTVSLAHGLLSGADTKTILDAASAVLSFLVDHPDDAVPQELLSGSDA